MWFQLFLSNINNFQTDLFDTLLDCWFLCVEYTYIAFYSQVHSDLEWFGLVWFYGISTMVGYLMPNPFLFI